MSMCVATEFGTTENIDGITGLGGGLKESSTVWLLHVSLKSMVLAEPRLLSLLASYPLYLRCRPFVTLLWGCRVYTYLVQKKILYVI